MAERLSAIEGQKDHDDGHDNGQDAPDPTEDSRQRFQIQVELPILSRKEREGYEPLPGSSIVQRILSRSQDKQGFFYNVVFYDGHRDQVSQSRLLRLENGRYALQSFKPSAPSVIDRLRREHTHTRSNRMVSTRGQVARRSDRDDFVDWSAVGISSSDDELSSIKTTSKHSRRRNNQAPPSRALRRVLQTRSTYRLGASQPESESESVSTSSRGDRPQARRSIRLKIASESRRQSESLDDENEEDTSDEEGWGEKKRRERSLQSSRSGPRHKTSQGVHSRSDYVHQRRSSRNRMGSRRSMREKGEDEISENEAKVKGTKVVGAKECFIELSERDPFRLRHRQICDTCSGYEEEEANPLIYCQGCTNSYHKNCLGPRGSREHLVTKVGDGNFVLQCRRCINVAHSKDSVAPQLSLCQSCNTSGLVCSPFRVRKTTRQEQQEREANSDEDPITIVDPSLLNNAEGMLFRCVTCQRAWHIPHLPPRSGTDDMAADSPSESIAKDRFDEYSQGWTCRECFGTPAIIDSLVAWRPSNPDLYVPGSTAEMVAEDDKEYLVKWKKLSYFQATWMPGAWVWGVVSPAMRRAFNKKQQNLPRMRTEDAIPEEWFRVDVVLDVKYTSIVSKPTKDIALARVREVQEAYIKYKGLGYEDVVWEKPPSPGDGERWLDFKAAYEDWVSGLFITIPSSAALSKHLRTVRAQDFESRLLEHSQPEGMVGGKMMDYQMEGLNWLYYKWYKRENAILADEMGLGKTIQLIALFSLLVQKHKCWPFLVVVPNSTCPNWRREIKKWAPHIRVVAYYGSSMARKLAFDHELFHEGSTDLKCHVVVTSYEAAVDAQSRKLLRKVPWAGLVVDEGQRLKNDGNLLYEALRYLRVPFQVLLTGTPLQNNTRELFNLLQFLDRSIEAKELEIQYENLTTENVPKLHELIRPFFLRRTKAQVLTFLPPMAQIIIPVTMSVVQKKLYKSILAKNPQLIKAIFSKSNGAGRSERQNLNNILMQLRKCLCHPFVYNSFIEERSFNAAVSHRNLVEASSKLQLLELMLPKLQERGHRALIFSQFLDMLDIMEDFLDGLTLKHRRLDGTMNAMEKQKRIDEFNAPESPYFAFLLSTRSGGVGINLATADTVIILDPDFNPHQDIQALSRAHRIGQTKKVLVFQLMTRGSAEEKIMQIGKKKMALDHILIERMDAEDDAGVDLESILRHGAEALFDDDNTGDIKYDSPSVDFLLDRSQAENTRTGEDASAESQFSFARVWTTEKSTFQDGLDESDTPVADSGVWEKILQERERVAQEEAAARLENLGRGKRKRLNVNYSANDIVDADTFLSPMKTRKDQDESDTDFQARDVESDVETQDGRGESEPVESDLADLGDGQTPVKSRPRSALVSQPRPISPNQVRPFKRARVPSIPPLSNQTDGGSDISYQDLLPAAYDCLACGERHPVGFCPLKQAQVEHCGLCGLAHFGRGRTCPHLNSELQVATMLGALKQSTEGRALVDEATKYLRGVRGDLVRRKKAKAEQEARLRAQPGLPVRESHQTNGHARPAYPIPSTPTPNFSAATAQRPTSAEARVSY